MTTKSLIITNSRYSEIVDIKSIVFFIANGSYCEIVLNDKRKITASKNLHWFEEKTANGFFFRVHKSYLINVLFVTKIFNNEFKIELSSGIVIPLSRSKKLDFWQKLTSLGLID